MKYFIPKSVFNICPQGKAASAVAGKCGVPLLPTSSCRSGHSPLHDETTDGREAISNSRRVGENTHARKAISNSRRVGENTDGREAISNSRRRRKYRWPQGHKQQSPDRRKDPGKHLHGQELAVHTGWHDDTCPAILHRGEQRSISRMMCLAAKWRRCLARHRCEHDRYLS